VSLGDGGRLGPYEIVGPLGAGGMGEVYLARDTRLGREVALKVLPPDTAHDRDRLARFEREARAVAALNHPNIVTLHAVEDIDGRRVIVMERVSGRPLSAILEPGGLPFVRLLEIAIPIADALSAAHECGVIHRDLKPANVMVSDEGRVKVLDFGLAKRLGSPTGVDSEAPTDTRTAADSIVGTIPYMAPEQLRGQRVDARADIFSFGVMLYEMAAGARPSCARNHSLSRRRGPICRRASCGSWAAASRRTRTAGSSRPSTCVSSSRTWPRTCAAGRERLRPGRPQCRVRHRPLPAPAGGNGGPPLRSSWRSRRWLSGRCPACARS
jgi:serine/threonine protein kinase